MHYYRIIMPSLPCIVLSNSAEHFIALQMRWWGHSLTSSLATTRTLLTVRLYALFTPHSYFIRSYIVENSYPLFNLLYFALYVIFVLLHTVMSSFPQGYGPPTSPATSRGFATTGSPGPMDVFSPQADSGVGYVQSASPQPTSFQMAVNRVGHLAVRAVPLCNYFVIILVCLPHLKWQLIGLVIWP
jgi:hypothetical protein